MFSYNRNLKPILYFFLLFFGAIARSAQKTWAIAYWIPTPFRRWAGFSRESSEQPQNMICPNFSGSQD
jgi:hypothetical protein